MKYLEFVTVYSPILTFTLEEGIGSHFPFNCFYLKIKDVNFLEIKGVMLENDPYDTWLGDELRPPAHITYIDDSYLRSASGQQ